MLLVLGRRWCAITTRRRRWRHHTISCRWQAAVGKKIAKRSNVVQRILTGFLSNLESVGGRYLRSMRATPTGVPTVVVPGVMRLDQPTPVGPRPQPFYACQKNGLAHGSAVDFESLPGSRASMTTMSCPLRPSSSAHTVPTAPAPTMTIRRGPVDADAARVIVSVAAIVVQVTNSRDGKRIPDEH